MDTIRQQLKLFSRQYNLYMTDDYFTDENGKQTKQAKMSIGSADGTTTDIYAMPVVSSKVAIGSSKNAKFTAGRSIRPAGSRV